MADEIKPDDLKEETKGFFVSLLQMILAAISANGGATVIGNFIADILAPISERVLYPLIKKAVYDVFAEKVVDSNPSPELRAAFERMLVDWKNNLSSEAGKPG